MNRTLLLFNFRDWARLHPAYEPYLLYFIFNVAYWAHPAKFLFFCPSAWASLRSAYEAHWPNRRSETGAMRFFLDIPLISLLTYIKKVNRGFL